MTDETNTKAYEAKHITEAFTASAALLGDVHLDSHICIQDVGAAACGHSGKTQEFSGQH